jgi:hypothetical protein
VLIRRASLYKGFLGGSRGWRAVGLLFWGTRLVKRVFGHNEEIVATDVLKPGQFVRIEAIPVPSRRQRRAARRAARATR